MGFRITTNMMMRNYRSNLQNSTNKLQNSWDKALKQRNFTSYAEDPGAATQAFTLRRAYYRNSNHLANTETVRRKFESASTAMGTVSSDLADKTARAAQLYAQNDPTSGGRASLGQVLNETAKSAVQTLNIRYGDHFIFAGNDGLNVPFSWDEKTGNLLYRGVNVNAGGVEQPSGNPPFGPDAIPPAGDPNYSQEWVDYYKDQDDLQKLKAMSEETNYVDIGMGLSEENGKLVTSSAFNSSVNGLSFLGYGVDEDGDPKTLSP